MYAETIWNEFSEQHWHQSTTKAQLALFLCKEGADLVHILVGMLLDSNLLFNERLLLY